MLLRSKVDTAVERLGALTAENSQLKAENDALRSKCAELTNALSEKTELVSNLEADQSKIEEGILLALNRLNTVENTVLGTKSTSPEVPSQEVPLSQTESPVQSNNVTETIPSKESENPVQQENVSEPVNETVSESQPETPAQPVNQPVNENQTEAPSEEGQANLFTEEPVVEEPAPDMARFEQEALFSKTENTESSINSQFDIF
jgi:seryl-tRNA synthetase